MLLQKLFSATLKLSRIATKVGREILLIEKKWAPCPALSVFATFNEIYSFLLNKEVNEELDEEVMGER